MKTAIEKVRDMISVDRRDLSQVVNTIYITTYEKVTKSQEKRLAELGEVRKVKTGNGTVITITLPEEEE